MSIRASHVWGGDTLCCHQPAPAQHELARPTPLRYLTTRCCCRPHPPPPNPVSPPVEALGAETAPAFGGIRGKLTNVMPIDFICLKLPPSRSVMRKGVIPNSSPSSHHVWSQWPGKSGHTHHRSEGLAPVGATAHTQNLGLLLSPPFTWSNWLSCILENKN